MQLCEHKVGVFAWVKHNELPSQMALNLNFVANLFVNLTNPFFLQKSRGRSRVVYGGDESQHPACIT